MPNQTPRKTRKDKGTRRNGRPDDFGFSFRLNPGKPAEEKVLLKIHEHFTKNPAHTIKDIIMDRIGNHEGPLTREEAIHETFDQQIERLAQTIDKLLSLNLQRITGDVKAQEDDNTSGVNMDYLKRIQQTLRGAKK